MPIISIRTTFQALILDGGKRERETWGVDVHIQEKKVQWFNMKVMKGLLYLSVKLLKVNILCLVSYFRIYWI